MEKGGAGKTGEGDGLQLRKKTQGAQADPGNFFSGNSGEKFLDRGAIAILPAIMVDDRIKMEGQCIPHVSHLAGCGQALVKACGVELFLGHDSRGI